jgi:hypothetical protein
MREASTTEGEEYAVEVTYVECFTNSRRYVPKVTITASLATPDGISMMLEEGGWSRNPCAQFRRGSLRLGAGLGKGTCLKDRK